MMRHVIIHTRTAVEKKRLVKFVNDNEDDYAFIRRYIRADGSYGDVGDVIACATEKAQFKIRLMFEGRDYVV